MTYQFYQQAEILYRVHTIPGKMPDRNVNDFAHRLSIRDKLIHRCHHNYLIPLRNQLADDIEPEIIDIPGGVGDDEDALVFQRIKALISKKQFILLCALRADINTILQHKVL